MLNNASADSGKTDSAPVVSESANEQIVASEIRSNQQEFIIEMENSHE
jgi:hypothetical protein